MKLESINLQGNDDKPPEIKSQRIEEKKTAIQWLKETSNSNEFEKYALELTAQLSLTVVDLLVIMQERKDLKQQFQQFKSKVELLMIDDDCFVSRHILNLLEIAETELKGTKNPK
ncbi:hypothetical protein L484_015651 [Morus notabilis]|uniref:Uncharacterized protein n=1 Tax=Morus notabilis TaxID=981085 RepID=W9RLF6_9ROSA|nr:hypothetical protein L484_015651 [Morus notabilis]